MAMIYGTIVDYDVLHLLRQCLEGNSFGMSANLLICTKCAQFKFFSPCTRSSETKRGMDILLIIKL